MNTVTMNGRMVGPPKEGSTQTGTPKAIFLIETDGGELPLRFSCICFGSNADLAGKLAEGDELLLAGKMTASAHTAYRAMTVVVTNLEILKRGEAA